MPRPALLLAPCLCGVLLGACGTQSDRKIRLAAEGTVQPPMVQSAASVLRVPSADQRTIAIVPFANATGDDGLDWLRRGLTDMLVAELAQSPFLKVSAVRSEATAEMDEEGPSDEDLAGIARSEKANTVLTGRFYRDESGLKIDAELRAGENGHVLEKKTVEGQGLEQIFRMVSELSGELRVTLRGGALERPDPGVKVGQMTASLEAFRQYSNGLALAENMLNAEADSAFSRAIELDPGFALAHLRQFRTKLAIGDPRGAGVALERARQNIDRLSASDRILLRIGDAQLNGDLDELNQARQELWDRAPYDIDIRIESAHLLFMLGDLDRALEEYQVITELDPDRAPAYNMLGYIYAYRSDTTAALKYLEKYRQLTPDQPNAYDSEGEVLAWAGRFDEARAQFETALGKWPAFYPSAKQLVDLSSELGSIEDALRYSDRWIASAPSAREKAHAWTARALHLARFHRQRDAEEALAQARALAPELIAPVVVGAEIQRSLGDAAQAMKGKRAYFEQHRDAVLGWPSGDLVTFLRFAVEANLPPAEVVPVVEKVATRENSVLVGGLARLYLALLELRAGDPGMAVDFFSHPSNDFLSSLSGGKYFERGMAWKYVVEAVHRLPHEGEPDLTFPRKLGEIAEKTKRTDLATLGQYLEAQYLAEFDRSAPLEKASRRLGAPSEDRWLVLGPFENRSGFHHRFPPEVAGTLAESYRDAGRELRWRPAEDGIADGYVDLRALLERSLWSVGYAAIDLHSPTRRVAQILLAAGGPVKLWLNDDLVLQVYRKGETPVDAELVKVQLRPGDNRLLVKMTSVIGDWGFQLRVTDERGNGYPDVEWRRPRTETAASAAASTAPR